MSSEIQLIQEQLLLERRHSGAVANACAAAPAHADGSAAALTQLRQAGVDYLVLALTAFEERDQRLADYVRDAPAQQRTPGELARALGRRGSSREALTRLEAAVSGRSGAWREFADFFNGCWSTRREAIEGSLGRLSTSEWRVLSGIDADSILQERQAFARVRASVPAGVGLDLPAAGGG